MAATCVNVVLHAGPFMAAISRFISEISAMPEEDAEISLEQLDALPEALHAEKREFLDGQLHVELQPSDGFSFLLAAIRSRAA